METIVKTAAGEHGGKHYFEDEEYVESKEKSTAQTAESVALAAAKLRKQAEEKRRKVSTADFYIGLKFVFRMKKREESESKAQETIQTLTVAHWKMSLCQ